MFANVIQSQDDRLIKVVLVTLVLIATIALPLTFSKTDPISSTATRQPTPETVLPSPSLAQIKEIEVTQIKREANPGGSASLLICVTSIS